MKKTSQQSSTALRNGYGVQLNNERGTKSHQNSKIDSRAYTATVHDLTTLKSEVLPLVSHSGRDDVALWLEWALSST